MRYFYLLFAAIVGISLPTVQSESNTTSAAQENSTFTQSSTGANNTSNTAPATNQPQGSSVSSVGTGNAAARTASGTVAKTLSTLPNNISNSTNASISVTPLPSTVDLCTTTNRCLNGGSCHSNGSAAVCACASGWSGFDCSADIDECTTSNHTCNSNTSVCSNTDGDYKCTCNSGYVQGTHSKLCVDFDECASASNNCTKLETCVNTAGSYDCNCGEDNFYSVVDGTCQKRKIEKVKWTIPRNSSVDLNDKESEAYKCLVKQLEKNVTELLGINNTYKVYRVKVIDLSEGSIKVTAVIQMNTTESIVLPPGFSTLPDQDEDYCVWNLCDPASTKCRGSAKLEDYSCECKDNSYEQVEGAYTWCRYKDECQPDTNKCSASDKDCQLRDGIYKCLPNNKAKGSDCDKPNHCQNSGSCIQAADGTTYCRCTDEYAGEKCQIKVVKSSKVTDLQNILIGVGVGLGSLALFCSIALIIVCCSDRSKSSKTRISSRHYVGDDITIDTWEPSLPRPKIKPGAFSQTSRDGLEMDERRQSEREAAGTENPAFIPEADYEISGKKGRASANGKKGAGDFVYF